VARAAVIVVSWNGEAHLTDCLAAILAQAGPGDDVIVVDNGSTDGSVALVRERYPRVRLVENGRNLGFAGGCNVGLRAAQADRLILVNQDVVAQAGWLEGLLEALALPEVGVAGSKLLYPDDTVQHAGGLLRYPLALPEHRGYREPDYGQWDETCDVDYVTGASMGLRRAVLDEIGLFDEGFFPAFYEETDLCLRAKAAGYRVVYAPGSRALHHETTTVARESTDYHRWMGRGRLRLVLKHYTPAQFHDDFVPAERAWLASLTAPAMREGLRLAYLDTLLALREMPRTGVLADPAGDEAVADLLIDLRGALVPRHKGQQAISGRRLLGALPWRLEEKPFTSRIPVLGPVIARFRELWNSVATRWYVRPLIEQQNEINRRLVDEVALLQQMISEVTWEMISTLDREATDARRLSAQAVYGLREDLSRLQARMEALEAAVAALRAGRRDGA